MKKWLTFILSLASMVCMSFAAASCGVIGGSSNFVSPSISSISLSVSSLPNSSSSSSSSSSSDPDPVHTHAWGGWILESGSEDGPCSEKIYVNTCATCGAKDYQRGTHSWGGTTTVDPTCTEKGYDAKTCETCGTVFKNNYVAAGHSWIAYGTDETHHWFKCTECPATSTPQEHSVRYDGTCRTCTRMLASSNGITYELSEDGEYAIVVDYIVDEKMVLIESTYKNRPVREIKENVFYGKQMEMVFLPETIKKIGEYAFCECYNLKAVYFGGEKEEWCRIAFADYDSNPVWYGEQLYLQDYLLTNLIIEESVGTISPYAFVNCESLKNVKLGACVSEIGREAFYDCESIETVEIGNSVTKIGDGAFRSCGVVTLRIGAKVAEINNDMFSFCRYLQNIHVKEGNSNYKSIDGVLYTKDGGTLLLYPSARKQTSFTIPDGVQTIVRYAFNSIFKLTHVLIPDSVTTIESRAFDCAYLTSIEIGESVTSIGREAFSYCFRLVNIQVDANNSAYQSIDGNLYTKDGKKLIQYAQGKQDTSFVVPDGVTEIGPSAFYDAQYLVSVTLPDGVTIIGDSAFSSCERLTNVMIPDSIIRVGQEAFTLCDSLQYTQEGYCKYLGNSENPYAVFLGVSDTMQTSYDLNANTKVIGDYAFHYCNYFTSITLPDGLQGIGASAFSNCKITSISIPDSVTYIGDEAFYTCEELAVVHIGNGVIEIGKSAFYYCTNLTTLTLGNALQTIGESAFAACMKLRSVTIPDSVMVIGDNAFSSSALAYVDLGNGVKSIGDYAFSGCALTSIVIPKNVEEIGFYAFHWCDKLDKITFSDTTTWYMTDHYDNFINKTGGQEIDVTKWWNNPGIIINPLYFYKK